MVLLLKKLINVYFYVNNDLQDPRAKAYPLMSNPFPTFAICAFYLYFVLKLGPKLMEKRKPLNINKIIIVYNIAQIMMCSFLVYEFITICFFRINWFCEPVDYGTGWYPSLQLFYGYVYYCIKIFDLFDTVFFVLRKKYSQISFLHCYHHTGMVILTWVGVKFIGGGHGLFLGFANCIVHTFMYFYYLMSILDENYKKSNWWKKYITQLQISQFFFLVVSFGQILFQPNCKYPKWVVVSFLPQNIFMLVLFTDFYYRAYIKKTPQPVTLKTEEKEEQFANSIQQNLEINEQKAK